MNTQYNKPDTPASEEGDFVIVPTQKYVKESIEDHAKSRNHPDATLEDKGFVTLSNSVNSDIETHAATSKAVKTSYDLANAANQNAINANNNANTRLEKNQNGADVPDKEAFVKNIGLMETVERAKNAVTIDILYPVGIVLWFAQNKNPNNLFTGTNWKYIGENKTVRLAALNGSNILSTGGNDSVTLTTAQIPAHNHLFSATTDPFDYGTKKTDSEGDHYHDSGWGEGSDSRYGYYDDTNNNYGSGHSDWDNFKFNTSTNGAHQHEIYIGSHTHTVSGTTSNTGNGEAIAITNAYIMLMGWYRTA
ncbi:tail fiber protein [Xenorhabdus lircayensis]|uniref:Tail fiber protein n=1 Tax=Xenorhabdus lircayensis TaxID=2763499 RepID=A0ABS0U7S1_9GAMM|nr:tail fiber protein [Xenorhabdus lircayensis]MBI6549929.1 tail fiber protein [Xenorhabdus lircayensis]